MDIYSSDAGYIFFSMPYNAKRLLDDSVTRTLDGYNSIPQGAIFTGCGDILLARVESVTAGVFVILSGVFLMMSCAVMTPCCLVLAIPLNLASLIPGVSSFESLQNFTQDCNDAIYRLIKVQFIAIPVIFLFLSASTFNTFLPGILGPQNIFFSSIHSMVESLGQLHTINAVVPGEVSVVGTETKLSIVEAVEEYLRAMSYQNYLREVTVAHLIHHYSYSSTS